MTGPTSRDLLEPHLYLSPRRSTALSDTEERKIHIRVEGELHRLLRIRCAELDVTIQEYVVGMLERDLRSGTGSQGKGKSKGRKGAE